MAVSGMSVFMVTASLYGAPPPRFAWTKSHLRDASRATWNLSITTPIHAMDDSSPNHLPSRGLRRRAPVAAPT
jgi:hypothetical protein